MEVFAKRLEYLPFDNSTEEIKPREIDSATIGYLLTLTYKKIDIISNMKDNLFCMNLAASYMQVLITSLSALFDKFVLGLDFAVCTYKPP